MLQAKRDGYRLLVNVGGGGEVRAPNEGGGAHIPYLPARLTATNEPFDSRTQGIG